MTCDIVNQSIKHNGLLWIGTYHTSTPFNANETNPNACIINEDCLLYCSPNPVTFKLNHTDTQCVDNRGQRMCGSCTEGYSLLMGSNKCGYCHNNYMLIAWIALFAVMGVLLVFYLIALNLQYQWVHSMVYCSMLTLSSYMSQSVQGKEHYQS